MFFPGRYPAFSLSRCAITALLVITSFLSTGIASSRPLPFATATVGLSSLPFEGQATYRLIQQGGPFPYSKDGIVFANRERLLPSETRGFYREYTVRTPGSVNRGGRRIVCGGRIPTKPETCYYSQDHYSSFQKIVH